MSRRSPSLRTRVALVSALAAAVVIAAIGVAFAVFLRVNGSAQLDRTLDSLSLHISPDSALQGEGIVIAGLPVADPAADGVRTTSIDGTAVRAKEVPVDGTAGQVLAVSVPEDALTRAIREQQWQVAGTAAAAIVAAAGLGWLLAGRAVRPLQRLAAATHTIGDHPGARRPNVRGAREAEELSEAIGHMLERIAKAQNRTEEALGSARDFAAVSAHELRTPLTSMRTDLEVLTTMQLSDEQRGEILRDLVATQRQVETTLTDLERLAVGELSDAEDHEEVDLAELADRCAQESARVHRGLDVDVSAPESLVVRGIPTGLRLVLDNAVTNAARHGGARRVRVTVDRDTRDSSVVILVDDDGIGVPHAERATVFERFVRGVGSRTDGSGLGLALVAQQAALHGGTAELVDSPLGGARLSLRLPLNGREA
ncbi:HAMP domain-containing histidine kinase [Rhodococcus spelaei]|uniref:histidine kinase n=1 Tax=Rhodococcus spelaei TaxID=2546320 RepID=A0A541BP53_9NOCA|nr:HAMP domain-containing sensor histidine kinase [Rhodococcus spelaei]TQF74099.1 HAMP domain-containing histidine kinase [Rhodococcus spelaei]